jgi:hypothetical protein
VNATGVEWRQSDAGWGAVTTDRFALSVAPRGERSGGGFRFIVTLLVEPRLRRFGVAADAETARAVAEAALADLRRLVREQGR